MCISKVSTASVYSAFDVPAFSTSHHGSLRACASSASWLHNAAAGYIKICKRRSDRFAMLCRFLRSRGWSEDVSLVYRAVIGLCVAKAKDRLQCRSRQLTIRPTGEANVA